MHMSAACCLELRVHCLRADEKSPVLMKDGACRFRH
jgi:hypothetical protein